MSAVDDTDLDPVFKHDVAAHPGGENIKLCFACGTCTAGCPVAEVDPEFDPRRIIRQVILGMRAETLASPVIWRCVQCYSCTAKCPQNVRFRDVMRALREMAVEEGCADAATIAAADELGRLCQKLRRDMADALVSDRARYEQMKQGVESLTGEQEGAPQVS